jgi:hypothetical protein
MQTWTVEKQYDETAAELSSEKNENPKSTEFRKNDHVPFTHHHSTQTSRD